MCEKSNVYKTRFDRVESDIVRRIHSQAYF